MPEITQGFPLLSLLLLTLPVGAGLIWLAPDMRVVRWITLVISCIDLFFAVTVAVLFDTDTAGYQFVEQADWIPSLNVQYMVGVDGISVLFLPLTVILFMGVILASWRSVRTLPRLYFSLLLLLESTTIGVFCAMDSVLFFLFWELTLAPLYFLISLWGIGPNRRYAATKYTLFMLAGGIPLLFGFVLLAFNHAESTGLAIPAGLAFDIPTLLQIPLPHALEVTVFFLLLVGFAVKVPLFPFHTWLPVVSMEGPASIAALMTGLKLGAYGLIRFVVPMAPVASQEYHWLLAGLGITGVLYGAVLALAQTNLRRMLAYSSISHVGLVVLGIASFNLQGIQGAIFQLLNFTVVAGGLFLLAGFLHQRTGSTDVINLGGVARSAPLMASFFFVFGLAAMGVPGTSGFPAEFLILLSALKTHTGAGLAALAAIVITAGYFLGIYRKAFLGPISSPVVHQTMDLRRRELVVVMVFTALILLNGLYPMGVLDYTRIASENWISELRAPSYAN